MRARPWSPVRRSTSRSQGSRSRPSPTFRWAEMSPRRCGVARLLRRRGIDIAVVENHLPAAALIAATSGARVLLHSHAYETAPRGAAGAGVARLKIAPLAGLAFVSEDALARFRGQFSASTRAPMRAIPNGLDMRSLVGDRTQGRVDPQRRPRARRQGPHRGDGGDRKRARRRGPAGAPASSSPPPTGSPGPSGSFAMRPKRPAAGSGSTRIFPMPRSRRLGKNPRSASR